MHDDHKQCRDLLKRYVEFIMAREGCSQVNLMAPGFKLTADEINEINEIEKEILAKQEPRPHRN